MLFNLVPGSWWPSLKKQANRNSAPFITCRISIFGLIKLKQVGDTLEYAENNWELQFCG